MKVVDRRVYERDDLKKKKKVRLLEVASIRVLKEWWNIMSVSFSGLRRKVV